jgi:hypothetical protein
MLLLVALAMAAQTPKPGMAMAIPPSLPAITPDVLPGEGWLPGMHKLRGAAMVFDTWKPLRRRIAVLEDGTPVIVLSGLSEVSKPDLITVTSPLPELQLKPGDSLLRYISRGEGYGDFWAKGRWYNALDGSFVTEADGTGCQSHCKARVTEPGRQTWWFRVRLTDQRTGWTEALNMLNPN